MTKSASRLIASAFATPAAVSILATTGKLRAAINFGNAVLAGKDAATGEPCGISVDLARELARRLGVAIEFVPYDAAGKVVEGLKSQAWDICFLAIDPLRAADISFTAPYAVIEGTYLVADPSPAIISGGGLAFARAIGEYGSVVLIGGNIPRRTQVASQYIQQQIEVDRPVNAAAVVSASSPISMAMIPYQFPSTSRLMITRITSLVPSRISCTRTSRSTRSIG